jgi:hypothetical protein
MDIGWQLRRYCPGVGLSQWSPAEEPPEIQIDKKERKWIVLRTALSVDVDQRRPVEDRDLAKSKYNCIPLLTNKAPARNLRYSRYLTATPAVGKPIRLIAATRRMGLFPGLRLPVSSALWRTWLACSWLRAYRPRRPALWVPAALFPPSRPQPDRRRPWDQQEQRNRGRAVGRELRAGASASRAWNETGALRRG